MPKKYFTREEANALLPSIRQDLEALQDTKRRFEIGYLQLQEMKAEPAAQTHTGVDPFFEMELKLEFMQIEARSLVDSIRLKGAELKDIERGLVDFPAIIGGQEVLLCWKLGEEGIAYYHNLHDGFSGRQPL